MPRFRHALLEEDHDGVIALSGCRDGEIARRLRVGDRAGARAAAERYASIFGRGDGPATSGFFIELVASPAARRRLARRRIGGARRRARLAGRRHERRPLRDPRRPRVPRRPDRDQARSDARHAGRPPSARCRVVPQVGRGAGGARGRLRRGDGASLARGHRDVGRGRGVVLGRSRVRAVPLPGLPGPARGDAVLLPVGAVLGGRPEALPPADLGGRQPARPRARRHRAGRPRRVLPHLLGPHALREGTGDPGPGPGQRDQLDRVVHARDQPGRADRPQPPVRALHQSGPNDLPGRRHRLQLGAPRGGHPVHLQALRDRSTPGWSATSSRTGRGRRCARWATRSGSRARWSIEWRRRSRRTTR